MAGFRRAGPKPEITGVRGDGAGGPIRWRMHLASPPEDVYAALNTDHGRASFWAESAEERDGTIHFRFINGLEVQGPILERRPPHRFSVDYMGGPATFDLTPDGAGGTDLLLTHEGVEAADWNETYAGWLNVLFPLKAYVVHGVDLRNHDPRRLWDDGFADQ